MTKHIGLIVICEAQLIPLNNTNTEILRWWEALGSYGQRLALKRFYPEQKNPKLNWDQLAAIYNETFSQCLQQS